MLVSGTAVYLQHQVAFLRHIRNNQVTSRCVSWVNETQPYNFILGLMNSSRISVHTTNLIAMKSNLHEERNHIYIQMAIKEKKPQSVAVNCLNRLDSVWFIE